MQSNEQTMVAAAELSVATAEQTERLPFCWGVAGVSTLWCFFHGRVGLGCALLLSSVFLTLFARLGMGTWIRCELVGWGVVLLMGSEGSAIARDHRSYQNVRELKAGEFGWTIAGGIFFTLRVLFSIGAIVAAAG
jgi:hypothetical protein